MKTLAENNIPSLENQIIAKDNEIHLIVGPRIKIPEELLEAYKKNNYVLKVHGNAYEFTDIKNLKGLTSAKNIIINAHGGQASYQNLSRDNNSSLSKSRHILDLNEDNKFTHSVFLDLEVLVKNAPINVQLVSCYANKASEEVAFLPMHSTLITSTSLAAKASSKVGEEIMIKSASFPDQCNPFTKFAFLIPTDPNNCQFAINHPQLNYVFKSSIDDFEDYSLETIQNKQVEQLKRFLEFIVEIERKPDTSEEHKEQITKTVSLLDNEQKILKFIQSFDIEHYRNLLLEVSIAEGKPISLIDKIFECGAISDNLGGALCPALMTHEDKSELIDYLVNKGADLNSSPSPVVAAIEGCFLMKPKNATNLKHIIRKGGNLNGNGGPDPKPIFIPLTIDSSEMMRTLLSTGKINKDSLNEAQELVNNPEYSARLRKCKKELQSFTDNPVDYISRNNSNDADRLEAIANLFADYMKDDDERIKVKQTRSEKAAITIGKVCMKYINNQKNNKEMKVSR